MRLHTDFSAAFGISFDFSEITHCVNYIDKCHPAAAAAASDCIADFDVDA